MNKPIYRIFETASVIKDFSRLPAAIKPKIESKLRSYVYPQLRQQPYFGANVKKLRNWSPETWRYRIGPWRLFYEINESKKIIFILTLDHRKDAY